jgi:RsiW-degrading membrane proteinase PrsW (M82 family)
VSSTAQKVGVAGFRSGSEKWLIGLAAAAGYWVAAVAVLLITRDSLVGATVVLVGGAAAPAAAAALFYERFAPVSLGPTRVIAAFGAGGGAAFLLGASIDTWLVPSSPSRYLSVGLIEELSKLVILLAFGVGLKFKTARVGMVLGGALGFGYAAFESTGYALDAYMQTLPNLPNFAVGNPVAALVWVEVSRAFAAPVTHGLWSAILGAVVFARLGGWRLPAIASTYLLVSLLHAGWDTVDRTARQLTGVFWSSHVTAPAAFDEFHLASMNVPKVVVFYAIDAYWTLVLIVIGILTLEMIERRRREEDQSDATDEFERPAQS